MWNDSNIVLHWLEGKDTYKQFVEHRVREICSLMPDVSWKYCPTDENPADFGTRRNTPRQLQESKLWWNGLSYLCTDQWPHQQHIVSSSSAGFQCIPSTFDCCSLTLRLCLANVSSPFSFFSDSKLLKTSSLLVFHLCI